MTLKRPPKSLDTNRVLLANPLLTKDRPCHDLRACTYLLQCAGCFAASIYTFYCGRRLSSVKAKLEGNKTNSARLGHRLNLLASQSDGTPPSEGARNLGFGLWVGPPVDDECVASLALVFLAGISPETRLEWRALPWVVSSDPPDTRLDRSNAPRLPKDLNLLLSAAQRSSGDAESALRSQPRKHLKTKHT